jgi:Skp family chaperone for outer membrane proteins
MKSTKLSASLVLSLCAILVLAFSSFSFAEGLKFGRVSFTDIQKNSKKFHGAMEEIQKVRNESQAKIEVMKSDVKRIEEQLQKPDIKADQKAKIQNELNEKNQELQTEEQAAGVKVALKQRSLQTAMSQQIKAIIEKLAKDEGFTAIFRSEELVYSDGLPDLTDKITQALDAAPPLEPKQ